ncbi:MAG: hypothetical protein BZY75_01560 [SAR202 cluster bacterium Io17-Chloro-G7]|nr:MAG: hypothetical protein BZY75_01560 [SAR202 cluster bacterium Io17-Chloro-G7]
MIKNLLHITEQTDRTVNSGFKVNSRLNMRLAGKFRVYLLGLMLLGSLAAISCTSGSYPVDIFYEMHYQQSYKSHEPPRLSAPASAVAFFPGPKSTAFNTGEHLFVVNCSMCHGVDAKGNGPVLNKLKTDYGYQVQADPDLTGAVVTGFGDDIIESFMMTGVTVMPSFSKLLSTEERELIIEYIRTLQ